MPECINVKGDWKDMLHTHEELAFEKGGVGWVCHQKSEDISSSSYFILLLEKRKRLEINIALIV